MLCRACVHTHSRIVAQSSTSIHLQDGKRKGAFVFGVWNHGTAVADSFGARFSFQPHCRGIPVALLLARVSYLLPHLLLGLVLTLRLVSLLLLLVSPLFSGLHRLPRRKYST